MAVSAGITPAPEMLMRKATSFERTAASGMIHPAWLNPQQPDLRRVDIAARLQVLDRGHGIAAKSSKVAAFQSPVDSPTPRLS